MRLSRKIQKNGVSNDDILRLFKEAQKELVAIIATMEAGSRFTKFRRQQLIAIDRIVVKLDEKTKAWAEEELPKIMEGAAEETYEQIKAFDEKHFEVAFAGVPNEMVNVFVEESWGDFGNTMVGLRKSARKAALEKRRIQERIFKGFVQGASATRTQEQIVKDLKKQGFTVLKAKNGHGRRFSLEAYSNMLVRTQNVTAYSLGAKSQMLASGRRYAMIPTIRPDIDGNDVCNKWERKTFVDLLRDDLPPYHPNCRHTPQPISFAQLKAERPALYKKAVRFFEKVVG